MPDSSSAEATEGDFEVSPELHADLGESLRRALRRPQPSIPPRFLYDELGSRLFEVITAIPEYYPTRTEAALLTERIDAILACRPVEGCTLIDVGAGNCEKSARLFDAIRPSHYVPVDVSADFLESALSLLRLRYPTIQMTGVGADFAAGLVLPASIPASRRLFFYPGSSIGNFSRDEAVVFLRSIRAGMGPDGTLWITVDLDKDRAVLERAYDDELGVTAAFNKNVLSHVNRLAGTDFALRDWRHLARYDAAAMRIELYLEAMRDLTVTWPGGSRRFRAGDRIHTENSHKFTTELFGELLTRAGLRTVQVFHDARRWLAFFVAAPV